MADYNNSRANPSNWTFIIGAAFLMATSAIGPGFLTQTTIFTENFRANLAFAILASVIIDIGAQMNIWRITTVSRMRSQEIANAVVPGLGFLISALIVFGGIAFNIGNLAGCALGFNILLGIPEKIGAIISCVMAITIFASREAGMAMDKLAKILGLMMIALTTYVMFASSPPVGDAIIKSVFPDNYTVLMLPMITLVGGTVGGYITFAGAHRLIDAGIVGSKNVEEVSKGAIIGVLITAAMRVIVFLAALGVVSAGGVLLKSNPAASVFQIAAGGIGYKLFGLVLWAASITSVVGAAYTSVSFLRTYSQVINQYTAYTIMGFIALSTILFVTIGKPIKVLLFAGALNGLILPIVLAVLLAASYNKKIMGEYKHPTWLFAFGILAVAVTAYAGSIALPEIFKIWG